MRCILALVLAPLAAAAAQEPVHRAGTPFHETVLPESRLKRAFAGLPEDARARARERLGRISIHRAEVDRMFLSADGRGVGVACPLSGPLLQGAPVPAAVPGAADVPVSPGAIPVHASRPGAPNTILLDFDGHAVQGTWWNSGAQPLFDAVPFSLDGDPDVWTDAERTAMTRIWQRVAEDYAPFDVNVTTVEPAVLTNRVCRVLITRTTDRNGLDNPYNEGGGVAWLGVTGTPSMNYDASGNAPAGPAWVYMDRMGGSEHYAAEAVSHEAGHTMGLSHDSNADDTSLSSYYAGHGGTSSGTSWAPIMGASYYSQITQWSKGEYPSAPNPEDDMAILAAILSYRADDHGDATTAATAIVPERGVAISAAGVITRQTDVDVLRFEAGAGSATFSAVPWRAPANSAGGNLDLRLILMDANGTPLVVAAPTGLTSAAISTTLTGGVYYLSVSGDGEPTPPASGYSAYASVGQWFLTAGIPPAGGNLGPWIPVAATAVPGAFALP